MDKIRRKSELGITGRNKVFDTARTTNAFDVLIEAERAWDALSLFRRDYIRNRNYLYGKQWNDRIKDPDTGKTITEEEYIKRQGKIPLKNNMIRQLVKNVLGQFSSNQTEPVCVAADRADQELGEMMSIAVKYAYRVNRMWGMDIRTLESFLIGAVACHKVRYTYSDVLGREDVIVENVNPARLFFDTAMEDFRFWDCDLIGEIHDLSIADLISAFSHGDEEKAKELRYKYGSYRSRIKDSYETLTSRKFDSMDFYCPYDTNLCRVIEVWRKESRERYKCHDTLKGQWFKIEKDELHIIEEKNLQRLEQALAQGIPEDEVPFIETEYFVDRYWYARWITPFGEVLQEMETPYMHGSHPYTLALYPFIDGEVHSFVADVIDQQRYINRLITMIDFIMGASAKGVLLFPEDMLPEGTTMEEIADQWVKYNGVIVYKPKPGVTPPQQISVNATNIGAYELLNLQMQLMSEISGVHSALRGADPKANTPSSLYAQQSQNSATNLIDLLEAFRSFREERDTKIMKTQQQYYSSPHYINVAGNNYSETSKHFKPEMVRNIDFDLSIEESQNTPAYRQLADEFLKELFSVGQIDLKTLLENSSLPFADRLLQTIKVREEEAAKQAAEQQAAIQMQQLQTIQQQGGLPQQQGQEAIPQVPQQPNNLQMQ